MLAVWKGKTMLAVRGIYDGKNFKALPSEQVPTVEREVPIAIIFLEDTGPKPKNRIRQVEAAKRMRAIRDSILPLDRNVKDLVKEGREH